jgi:hypothetical protein
MGKACDTRSHEIEAKMPVRCSAAEKRRITLTDEAPTENLRANCKYLLQNGRVPGTATQKSRMNTEQ